MTKLIHVIKNKCLWQVSLWFSGFGRRRGPAWEAEKTRIRDELDARGVKRHSFLAELWQAINRLGPSGRI